MDETSQSNQYITAIPIVSGFTTIALGLVLLFFKGKSKKDSIDAPAVSVPEEEVEELDKSKYPGGYLSIFYGSQTGTAESFARDLEREGEDKGFKVNVVDLEDVEEDVVGNILSSDKRDEEGRNRALFLMATYGEGEPTDNAASFVNFLKMKAGLKNNDSIGEEQKEEADSEQTDPLCFKGLHYAVFGLGNTQYEHYNAMGKTVDEGLGNTGAQRLLSIGLGDDDKDLDGDFESWKDEKLWPTIEKLFIPKDAGVSQAKKEELPKCHYRVEFVTSAAEEKSLAEEDVPLSSKAYFNSISCPINVKKELRNESDDGSTMHIEFDLSNANDALSYQTADNLGILPVNHDDVVKGVAEALGYDLTAVFKLKPSKGYEAKFSQLFPNPCTIQEFLASFCDLSGSPRRSDLKLLAPYAKGTLCKKALLRMASKEGKQEYREKIVDCKLGYADIISKLCPTIEMPLEHFISVCPRLSPRYYTISSSSTVHPNNIHVTVSVLEEKRKDGSSFKGVCSNFLASMIANGTARIFVKESSFRLPSDPSKPIILIGPGTGIAPMRALLQERAHQRNERGLPVGENVLYFGCKNRSQDFIYSDELYSYEKDGTLKSMYLAFSREQKKKVYVQHLISNNANETWDLMDKKGAYIYVCGGVRMGSDVSAALQQVICEKGGMSSANGKAYLDKLQSSGRFVQELWA